MATTKNLCAQIPIALHERVSEERERLGQTTSEYIANLIQDYYNMMENQKGGIQMTEKGRTMAFQIPEELFQRIKRHLERETLRTGKKLTQRDFVLNLITQALDEADAESAAEQDFPAEAPAEARVDDEATPADTDTPDEESAVYAEIKALASGNPMIKEKMDLDIEVSKLKLLKSNHLSQRYALEDAISKTFPKNIAEAQERISGYEADIAAVKENTHPNADGFSPLVLMGVPHTDKKEAGAALLTMCQTMLSPEATQIGSYRGLTLELAFDTFAREYRLTMIGQLRHTVTLGTDVFGNLQRMDNALEGLPIKEQACREQLSNLQTQLETAKAEVQKPFPREEELTTKTARLEELNTLLNLDHKEPEIVDTEPDEDQRPPERRRPQLER